MRKPTMSDVARRAGVDVSTVSRALSPRTAGMLRPETVQRVLDAAEELGYRPNLLARSLRTQRSHTVGFVIPDLANPFFPPIARGAEEVLADADYTLIIANTDNDSDREQRSVHTLVSRQVDGLLVATANIDGGQTASDAPGVPVVLVNRQGPDTTSPSVAPDDRAGITLVMEHLLGLGHRHIAHVAGPGETSTGHLRATAFREVAAAAGIADDRLIEPTSVFGIEQGHDACLALLDRRPELTAIVAGNDLLAVGCLRALRERAIRVPEDVSLVGFNDMPLTDLIDPPLTTIRVPQPEMGRVAARMLLRLIDGADPASIAGIELAPALVERRSTAPPRTA